MRRCAINTGLDTHLLDHIAPLAAHYSMPLIVAAEESFALAQRYYPMVEVSHRPHLDLELDFLAQNFDALFECKFWKPHLKALFRDLYRKEMQLTFCPHGFSDKTALLDLYATQDAVLLYGQLHLEMLQHIPLKQYAFVGNYRLAHYQKHRDFYDALVDAEVFSRFATQQPTLLYAPTWWDAAHSTTFFEHARWILSQIPSTWNLLVKVHPLLEQRNPAQYYSLEPLFNGPNIVLLSNFPLVYPLLARADAYLGDFSSVGYDFLYFQRPMLFLPNDRVTSGPLRQCGPIVDLSKPLMEQMTNRCCKLQQDLCKKTFNPRWATHRAEAN